MTPRAASVVMALAALVAGCASPPAKEPPRPAAVAEPAPSGVVALPSPIRSVAPWEDGGCPGVCVCTERYCLRLAMKDTTFRERLPAYMEACSDAYAKAIVPLPVPTERMDIYVFASRDPWEAWTRRTLGREADLYIGLGRGGFTSDGTSVLYDIGRVDTLTILAHEGWHQFSQKSLKEPLPTWLEEGLACWMEGTRMNRDGQPTAFRPWRNFERWNETRNAVGNDSTMSLEELLETSPQKCLERGKNDLLTYYAQAWALVHFLNEAEGGRHREGLRRLLQDAAAGSMQAQIERAVPSTDASARRRASRSRNGTLAFRAYFGDDLKGMSEAYANFLEAITRRGAGDRIWRGENPLSEPTPAAKASPAPPASK